METPISLSPDSKEKMFSLHPESPQQDHASHDNAGPGHQEFERPVNSVRPFPLDTPRSLSPDVVHDSKDRATETTHTVQHRHLTSINQNGSGSIDAQDLSREASHARLLLKDWHRLQSLLHEPANQPVFVDHANTLTIADVVAVAKHDVSVNVEDTLAAIQLVSASVDALRDRLEDGHSLYGITTGFGGSANTRTNKVLDLQRALLQHQQSGVLPVVKRPDSMHAVLRTNPQTTFMPEQWVRAAMLIRCKSLLNGHSALRFDIIEVLIALLNANLIPLVPLRGSISASGDLQPLSYIAGAIEGNPDIWLWTDDGHGGRDLIPAPFALAKINRRPQTFGPKEGLAVLNGTAFSCAVAALALDEAHRLAMLTQVLTTMGVEALSGTAASFDPFFAKVRPHKGQAEAANNIRQFLAGSSLAQQGEDVESADSLRQDRYALRTASQWIGPQLEDLTLAHQQLTIECNSTTDNPLLDVEDNIIHHGGNFQAAAVTSAMEKARLSLQMFGRMLFAQCTELINPATNNGLPPNLVFDDPSTSYTFKGVDINVAAYMSELAYLANPVSSHVQTAEMGNQAINSLALISARYTHQAIDVLSLICASYIYALCQALDLRVIGIKFKERAIRELRELTCETFEYVIGAPHDRDELCNVAVHEFCKQLPATVHLDARDRFQHVADNIQGSIIARILKLPDSQVSSQAEIFVLLREWNVRCASRLHDIFIDAHASYDSIADAGPYLGRASRAVHDYVRNDLHIPLHKGLADCPSRNGEARTVGSNISLVYEALREGKIMKVIVECLEQQNDHCDHK